MTYETLKVERRGHVGWLLFNRPQRRNAMNNAMRDELRLAWKELADDPAVRVIVNSGIGPHFQTGADGVEIAFDGEGDMGFTSWFLQLDNPVIAAVNGICAGGGLHFIADADIVIAASDAQFTDPHVSVGQVTAIE